MTEKFLEIGILALLVYLPLDFGGVTPRALLVLELGSASLALFWLFAVFLWGKVSLRHNQLFPALYLLFLTVIFFQLIPLPASIVTYLSPSAYKLYAEGASATDLAMPRFLPLSVCPQATEEEFMKLAAYGILFFLTLNTVRTRRQRKRFLYVILFVGFLESFYGLIQFISGNHSLYTRLVSPWVHGTFVNKNHFAAYMEMVILLVFGLLVARFEAASTDTGTPPEEKYIKAFFFGFVLVLMMSAHLLSGSRGGFVSLNAGMLCFLLLASLRGLSGKKFSIVLLVFTLTIGGILAFQSEKILPRLETLTQGGGNEIAPVRNALRQDAFDIFEDYPLMGSGSGTFSHLFRRYRSFRSTLIYDYAENDYAQLLSENGLVGVGLLLAAALFFFSRAFNSWKHQRSKWQLAVTSGGLCAMLSLFLHALFDFPFHLPANAVLFFVIAAICVSTDRKWRQKSHRPARRMPVMMGILLGLLLIAYSVNAVRTYSAYRHSQIASSLLSIEEKPETPLDVDRAERIFKHFQTAVRLDRNHPEFSAALGNVLIKHADSFGGMRQGTNREHNLSLAESSLKRAVMLDPANPWYYYTLGKLSYQHNDCQDLEWHECPVTHYFSSAFENAPKNIFLRKTLGAWYSYFDRDVAYAFLKDIAEQDRHDPFALKEKSMELAKLFYDVGLDYDSDREAKFLRPGSVGACDVKIPGADAVDRRMLEVGNDDGTAEWKTVLGLESDRIKKEICLPENLADYHTAALKILMARTGQGALNIKLYLDDKRIEIASEQLSPLPEWHEIPVDIQMLQEKSSTQVYLRAEASSPDNSLLIWGDRDTLDSQSTLNFKQKNDLSPEAGKQEGEYMIRLVLKK